MKKNIISLLLCPIPVLLIIWIYEFSLSNSIKEFFLPSIFLILIYLIELFIIFPIFINYKRKLYSYIFCMFLGIIIGVLPGVIVYGLESNINTIDDFLSSRGGIISMFGVIMGFIVSSLFYMIHKKLNGN